MFLLLEEQNITSTCLGGPGLSGLVCLGARGAQRRRPDLWRGRLRLTRQRCTYNFSAASFRTNSLYHLEEALLQAKPRF